MTGVALLLVSVVVAAVISIHTERHAYPRYTHLFSVFSVALGAGGFFQSPPLIVVSLVACVVGAGCIIWDRGITGRRLE